MTGKEKEKEKEKKRRGVSVGNIHSPKVEAGTRDRGLNGLGRMSLIDSGA